MTVLAHLAQCGVTESETGLTAVKIITSKYHVSTSDYQKLFWLAVLFIMSSMSRLSHVYVSLDVLHATPNWTGSGLSMFRYTYTNTCA